MSSGSRLVKEDAALSMEEDEDDQSHNGRDFITKVVTLETNNAEFGGEKHQLGQQERRPSSE